MATEDFLTELAGGVLTLTFNRPEAGNALSPEAAVALTALFRAIGADSAIRSVLVRGEGRNFSAGGDVRVFAQSLAHSPEERRADWAVRQDRLIGLAEAFLAIEVPVVAACQGGVVGAGLMYALGADYVIADDTVTFAFAHQRLGLTPDGGVSFLLPRAVGERQAKALILTAARVGAADALRLGLVERIVAADTLRHDSETLARRLAEAPARVVRTAKRMVTSPIDVATALRRERDAIIDSVCYPDFDEGVSAFLDKREPVFT